MDDKTRAARIREHEARNIAAMAKDRHALKPARPASIRIGRSAPVKSAPAPEHAAPPVIANKQAAGPSENKTTDPLEGVAFATPHARKEAEGMSAADFEDYLPSKPSGFTTADVRSLRHG